jgi:hypothetical protein
MNDVTKWSWALAALVCGAVQLASPGRASAEEREVHVTRAGAIELTLAESLELGAIETQSDWATALYVASIASWGGALGMVILTVPATSANDDAFCPMVLGAGALTLGGLVALPIAIGLDADAGSRRGGFERRVVLRLHGTGVSLAATF